MLINKIIIIINDKSLFNILKLNNFINQNFCCFFSVLLTFPNIEF